MESGSYKEALAFCQPLKEKSGDHSETIKALDTQQPRYDKCFNVWYRQAHHEKLTYVALGAAASAL